MYTEVMLLIMLQQNMCFGHVSRNGSVGSEGVQPLPVSMPAALEGARAGLGLSSRAVWKELCMVVGHQRALLFCPLTCFERQSENRDEQLRASCRLSGSALLLANFVVWSMLCLQPCFQAYTVRQ